MKRHRMCHAVSIATLLCVVWLCAACSKPKVPDKERPPEPQAAAVNAMRVSAMPHIC